MKVVDFRAMFFHGSAMPKITLTLQQKSVLESRHKRTRDARECDRIKAVLLRLEDWSIVSIAQALRKSEFTISRHLDDYLTKEKLRPENGGSESHLDNEQTRQLVEHLTEHINRCISISMVYC